jgi:pimeloyl-ACP methyl ester carboxylesterase
MRQPELVRFGVGGAELAVRLRGDQDKPALLLIHGFPSSSKSLRNVIGTLARDCFVIAPDLPGFGGSEPIERSSFSHFADIIDGLLARLGIGPFHLYLHYYGAQASLTRKTR